jgi:putative ABC transport system ATP-binding protein
MIELEGVEKEYSTTAVNVRALAGVDLRIASGEFVAVTGASGSGKSTLLNILGCLDRPTSGRYRLEGAEIDGCSDEALSAIRNRRIGFVFQSFHLLPRLTILENVLLPLRFARAEVSGGLEHAHALLARVGLSDRVGHRPDQISGGQSQRAAIARALLMRPALLLADEPTGNLDSRSAADILSLMAELHAEGQTIVMVTHDLELAGRAQRRVHLKDGSIDHDSMR